MTWADAGIPAETRFWARVVKTSECWIWTGRPSGGYGRIYVNGKRVQAHRFSYELAGGTIPEGWVLDHLCRNKLCVRPDHCEPVTNQVNVIVRGRGPLADQARQTRCKRDHTLSGENLIVRKNGKRECRACKRTMRVIWDQKNLAKVNRQKRESYHRRKTTRVGD